MTQEAGTPSFRILPAGEAAIVVELPERIDPELNAWCVALARALVSRFGTVVRDVVIGYCSVTVYFDPLRVDAAWLEDEVRASAGSLDVETGAAGSLIEVPVCYGGDMGPDLAHVAAFAACSEAEAIELHASREYRVYMVGFVPGFAYMAEVEPRIAAPRRASPRAAVPAGSVAIAGGQTGIYPTVTPGGWNIIGRTPIRPYDPDRREPFLFRSGDRVRFRAISAQEFRQP
jgi:KipI family sensor histidine kinase inhibitor